MWWPRRAKSGSKSAEQDYQDEIKALFSCNFLKLKSDKTKVVLFGIKSTFTNLDRFSIVINSSQVESLGSMLSFQSDISNNASLFT